jgi:DNA-directed RNA polymerase specialized sigma subunit
MLGSPDAEQGLAVRDARGLISRAMRDLPRSEQKLICWRYWHDAAMQDIARALHISIRRAYELHAHAIQELRCALARRIHIAIRGPGNLLELLLRDDRLPVVAGN